MKDRREADNGPCRGACGGPRGGPRGFGAYRSCRGQGMHGQGHRTRALRRPFAGVGQASVFEKGVKRFVVRGVHVVHDYRIRPIAAAVKAFRYLGGILGDVYGPYVLP